MAGRFAPRRPEGEATRATVRGGSPTVPRPAGTVAEPAGDTARTAPPRAAVRTTEGVTRAWDAPEGHGPIDLGLVLGPLRRGPGDPCFRACRDGSWWRASRTPEGPGTLRVALRASAARVEAEAWGPGARWLLETLPALLGSEDAPELFIPRHRLLAHTRHRRPGLRLLRTGLVMESLIPSVLEQKITTEEAYRAWRLLVRRFGVTAPGPGPGSGAPELHVMPEPRGWALIPSWEWHRAGVDDKRASTILRSVRVANRLEEAVGMEPKAARARLELVPGIGPWTSAETVQRSHGAPDEVTTGDVHLPGIIGHALGRDRDADDAAMLRLLEPYAGQRHRAARLVLLSGAAPARRAPKMRRTDISKW